MGNCLGNKTEIGEVTVQPGGVFVIKGNGVKVGEVKFINPTYQEPREQRGKSRRIEYGRPMITEA
jgi:hypothetical protein